MKIMYNIYELSKCLNCYTMENLLASKPGPFKNVPVK